MKTLILSLLLGSFALVNAQNITPPQLPPCLKVVSGRHWGNIDSMAVDTCRTSPTFGDYYGYKYYRMSFTNSNPLSFDPPVMGSDFIDTTWQAINSDSIALRNVIQSLEDSTGSIRMIVWKIAFADNNDTVIGLNIYFPRYLHARSTDSLFKSVLHGHESHWAIPEFSIQTNTQFEETQFPKIELRALEGRSQIAALLPTVFVKPSDMLIVDMLGNEMQRIRVNNPSVIIDTQNLPSGAYFVLWNGRVGRFVVGGKQ